MLPRVRKAPPAFKSDQSILLMHSTACFFEIAPKTAKTSKDAETRIQTSDSPPCGLATSGRAEFKETLGSLTEAVSAHDARIDSLESALKKMEGVNTALQQKIEDLEGRSRRNNIRIIGVPEGAEGKRPTDFVAELLPKLLGEENFNLPLVVDRAHRSLQPRPADGARPRPIIARIHLFQVKEKIMQLRRLHGPLQFRSNKVWRLARPLQNHDMLLMEPDSLVIPGCVLWVIVMLERPATTHLQCSN
ncbi:hypothetical protein NFI96_004454 [Prochilodus magdalenae]|nr:hypothetical protein NFI96_004454 [Prochilodus magdalenae]